MRRSLKFSLAAMALTVAGSATAQAQMRFEAMDTNRDHVVTRAEWRGTDRDFRNADWDGDGVLSGEEVRSGARRATGWNQDWNRDGIVDQQDTLIAQRFRGYDRNADSRVAVSEWPGQVALFRRLDANRDGFLSINEYTNNGGYLADSQGGPAYTFGNLDRNRDGWLTRNEWNMGTDTFNRLDANRDNRISNNEFQNDGVSSVNERRFVMLDTNRDNWITRAESHMSNAEFNRMDTNKDNRLNRYELDGTVADNNWNSVFVNTPFQNIDNNRNGSLDRTEWQWNDATFYRTDTNNDGIVSRLEFETATGHSTAPPDDRFSTVDRNDDTYIARNEWTWGDTWFDRVDTNRDNRVSRSEFEAASRYYNATTSRFEDTTNPNANRSQAYQAGFDRGTDEGRMAGREDRVRNQGWDLEGQRELERADSGYYSQLGSLSDYQAGYREGFRQAYREGYNSR